MRSSSSLIRFVVPALGAVLFAGSSALAQTILISYTSGSTIEKFSPSGSNLGVFTNALLSGGGVNTPTGMAVDSSGNVYIANSTGFGGIEKFSPTGTDLGAFYTSGFLNTPVGLAFDGAGNLYVANAGDNTIVKISSLGSLTTLPAPTGGLSGPFGVAVDSTGNVYVTNSGGNAVEKYSSSGSYLGQFATASLSGPAGLAFSSSGHLFVANSNGGAVVEFSSSGDYVGEFATGLGSLGGLAIDSSNNLYVTSTNQDLTGKFSLSGTSLGTLSASGLTSPQFVIVLAASAIPEPLTSALVLGLGVAVVGIHKRRTGRRNRGA